VADVKGFLSSDDTLEEFRDVADVKGFLSDDALEGFRDVAEMKSL
jgi:hypothetical protein